MQNNFKDIEFLKQITTHDYESFLKLPPLIPFSKEIIDYLNALSKEINKDPLSQKFPDVCAFSFFCRTKPYFYQYFFSMVISFSKRLTSDGELFALPLEREPFNRISDSLLPDDIFRHL